MNIIIVGCGKVGSALAEQLSKEDNDVTIVDLNYELVQDLSSDLTSWGWLEEATTRFWKKQELKRRIC